METLLIGEVTLLRPMGAWVLGVGSTGAPQNLERTLLSYHRYYAAGW